LNQAVASVFQDSTRASVAPRSRPVSCAAVCARPVAIDGMNALQLHQVIRTTTAISVPRTNPQPSHAASSTAH
jgi:hypothetical protein